MTAQRKSAQSTRQKAATKKPTRSKLFARKPKPAQKSAASAPARKTASRKTPTMETIARRIVRLTTGNPSKLKLEELYSDDCTSHDPASSEPVIGREGLQQNLEQWMAIQDSQKWKARNVFIKRNTICIEWEGQIAFTDGRSVTLEMIAIHEIRGGKIVAERLYYDPAILAPPPEVTTQSESEEAEEVEEPEEEEEPVPEEIPPNHPLIGSPPLDPMDL